MTADGLVFVDSNVLVYAYDERDPVKRQRARAVLGNLWSTRQGALSGQVLVEFFSVATSTAVPRLDPVLARRVLAAFAGWPVVPTDADLALAASSLHERDGLAWWDALIVAAARRVGASRILSEDLQAGRDFDGVVIENPFA